MIAKLFCDCEDESNYAGLDEKRKLKYQKIYKEISCNPDMYVLSVDVANPNSKDQSCVIKYNYEEFLKGNKVVESIEYF
jgi:hypothetical protein